MSTPKSDKKALPQFDREKYLQIQRTAGPGAALTQLQKDTVQWEIESFEGQKGYDPEMWEALNEVRQFSRELWEKATLGD